MCRPFPPVVYLGALQDEADPAAFVRALHDATEPDGVLLVRDPRGELVLPLADSGFDVVSEYSCPLSAAGQVPQRAGGGRGGRRNVGWRSHGSGCTTGCATT